MAMMSYNPSFSPFSALAEDEKCSIRDKLLRTLNEPVRQIVMQIAVLVGKAAR